MKKVLGIIVAVCAATALVTAQSAGPKSGAPGAGSQKGQKPGEGQRQGAGRMRMGMNKEMMDKLGLSAGQKTKLEALNKSFMEKMQAARKGAKPGERPSEADRAKMKSMFESYQKSVNEILTPAQRTKLEQLRKEMREKMEKERGNRPAGAPRSGAKPPL